MSHFNLTIKEILIFIACIIFVLGMVGYADYKQYIRDREEAIETQVVTTLYPYHGKIYHIFFHSLIDYPELAFRHQDFSGYRDYMVTKDEFTKILPLLHKNNFILINQNSIFSINTDGTIIQKQLFIPKGKKPLILSLDDLNYYSSQNGDGLAIKLVLDENGRVATEVPALDGSIKVTRDGDVVPIVDDFINDHPDFSHNGAKGIIALTGFEGILGYRTNNIYSPTYIDDVMKVKQIVQKLKSTGWTFASHSYSHKSYFKDGDITLDTLIKDTEKWSREVEPLVGSTDTFVGPFGQIFKTGDPRREYLVSKGFKVFYGVGMDLYLKYEPDHLVMNRANIDGIRLFKTPHLLDEYFDTKEIIQ